MIAQDQGDRTARVTVIVVTYESRRHLPQLRDALARQSAPYRLLVWDNASHPEARPQAEDFPPGAEIVQSEDNLGFAAANNRAVERATTEFVALLNPDAFPEPDWVCRLLEAADANPRAAAIGSTQTIADDPDRYDGLGDGYHAFGVAWRGGSGHVRTGSAPEGETFSACAAGALYRTAAWREVGGFDETFFCYGEDVDLGFRLRLAGYTARQAGAARIAHVGGGSSDAISGFAVFHGTRNRLWTFVKNMPPALFWTLLPAHFAVTALFLAVSPFRGTGEPTWAGFAAGLRGLPRVWRARRAVQRLRRVGSAQIARALTWNLVAPVRLEPAVREPR